MFVVNDDMSIYLTRGDIAFFTVTADNNGVNYKFQPGDVVRIKVTEKKACENVIFQKDFPVTEEAEKVEILLTEEETKIGEVISKPTDYWYEIELNPYTNPQTIVGYDDDGAKVLKLFPEGRDLEPTPVNPEDVPVVDNELSLTSDRPVQNQAISRAITGLSEDIKYVRDSGSERMATIEGKLAAEASRRSEDVLRLAEDIAVERARINNLAANTGEQTEGNAELIDVRTGADGTVYETAGEAVRGQVTNLKSDLSRQFNYITDNMIHSVTEGYLVWINGNGRPTADDSYCYTNFIKVNPSTEYKISRNNVFLNWYTSANFNSWIFSDVTMPKNYKATSPANAQYLVVSFGKGGIDDISVTDNTTLVDETPKKYFERVQKIITCGSGKDFTRLRDAIEYGVKYPNSKVIVYPGTYDLTQEFSEEIAAKNGESGISLSNGIEVVFMAGSYVTAIFDDYDEWVYDYFQPFYSHFNNSFTLNGLNIKAKNTRYCVHDEHGGFGVYYHKYINCVMEYINTSTRASYTQCIGGGLGEHGYIDIVGGKYVSVDETASYTEAETPTISYHNGAASTCDSNIFINAAYVSGCFQFGSYGTSTIKSKVQVSNCSMASNIVVGALADGSYNYELTEWNNTIRN